MKAPPPSRLTACLLLIVLLLVVVETPSMPGAGLLAPVLVALLAAELDRSGSLIGVRIVRLASRALPRQQREESCEEWIDHVLSAGEAGTRPVLAALSISALSVPRLVFRTRVRARIALSLLVVLDAYLDISKDWATVPAGRRGIPRAIVKTLPHMALPVQALFRSVISLPALRCIGAVVTMIPWALLVLWPGIPSIVGDVVFMASTFGADRLAGRFVSGTFSVQGAVERILGHPLPANDTPSSAEQS